MIAAEFKRWLFTYPDRVIEPWKTAAGHAGILALALLLKSFGVPGVLAAALSYSLAILLEVRDKKIYGLGPDNGFDLLEYSSAWIAAFNGWAAAAATGVYLVVYLGTQVARFLVYGREVQRWDDEIHRDPLPPKSALQFVDRYVKLPLAQWQRDELARYH